MLFMKNQLIWVFVWRKSVHYWWSYILLSPECKELTSMLDPLLYMWGVPPVVIRCVHCTMQMWVLQTWITVQGPDIVMRWMALDLTDDKPTLVQVMATCPQATSHYQSQCWPRFKSPYDTTKPQWVNSMGLKQNACHFVDDIFEFAFLHENLILIKIFLKFLRAINQNWFRYKSTCWFPFNAINCIGHIATFRLASRMV